MEVTMNKTVAIGIQSFEKIREADYYYIDKTKFIKEWWDGGDDVTLITKPRRFGKTLNMSMVEQFFNIKYANRGELFEGLSIWEDETYRKLQGTYPVISLSFAGIKENDYLSTKKKIVKLLKDLYTDYSFLIESDALLDTEKKTICQMREEMDDVDASLSIHLLSKYLYKHYGKKTIVILDEYDTPMQEAYINGYWDELVAFTRSLFNSTFKTNPYMERGLMTGITRVSKESIFSDLNNLEVITTTSEKYATDFGFTEQEVFTMLEEMGLSEEKAGVKEWYDGFVFGSHKEIYNPWSVLNFIDKKVYTTYWANTSGNRLVGKLLREGNSDIKELFECLINGEVIRCPIDEQIVYNQLDYNEDAVWSLLVASGYLKVLAYEKLNLIPIGKDQLYDLQLTNGEVRRMFYTMVKDWFAPVKKVYNSFVKALLAGDIEEMNEFLNHISENIFSYFDVRQDAAEPERFYHGLMLGLVTELSTDYIITSNRESGFGRYDVMIEPGNGKDAAYILEFKVHKPKKEATLEETAANALKQIEDKKYEAILIEKGFQKEKIHKYGFAFKGKEVFIAENNKKKGIRMNEKRM